MVEKSQYFGALAVSAKFITREQLDECLAIQQMMKLEGKTPPKLGELLEEKGYLTQTQFRYLLETKDTQAKGPFGRIAVNLRFVSQEQLQLCLRMQELLRKKSARIPFTGVVAERYSALVKRSNTWGRVPRIGEILYEMGYMKPHQIEIVLKEQGKVLVRCASCKASFDASNFSPGARIRCGQCGTVLEIVEDKHIGKLTTRQVQEKLSVPKTLGEFELGRVLGKDGSGVIYEALQPSKGRKVALKIFNESAMKDRTFSKQLLEETRRVAKFEHPNIRRMHKFGRVGDRVYMAMEYLDGASVLVALAKGGRFSYQRSIDIGVRMAGALAYAHERGVLHRDVRPSNIFLTKRGEAKLVNLGLASKTLENIMLIVRSGEVTPFYVAPEQVIEGMSVDHRCDIYGLGATLYHMIAGRPPYEGRSPFEIMVRLTGESSEDVRPPLRFFDPGIPDSLEKVIDRMLQADPDVRYPDFDAVLQDLGTAGAVESRTEAEWRATTGPSECKISTESVALENVSTFGSKTVQVIHIKGALDPRNFPTLERTLAQLSMEGHNNLVIDCTAVEYISSVALDALNSFAKEARRGGGDLRFASVPENVRQGMDVVGIAKTLRIYEGVHGAVQSFKYL